MKNGELVVESNLGFYIEIVSFHVYSTFRAYLHTLLFAIVGGNISTPLRDISITIYIGHSNSSLYTDKKKNKRKEGIINISQHILDVNHKSSTCEVE